MINGISNQRVMVPLRFDSKGDQPLTDQERQKLSKEFNVNDMTSDERMQLLGQLTEDGVLSSEDFEHAMWESFEPKVHLGNSGDAFKDMVSQKTDDTKTSDWVKYYADASQSTNDSNEQAYDQRIENLFSKLV